MKYKIFLILFFLMISCVNACEIDDTLSNVDVNEIHVNVDGNDLNDGTYSKPYLSINKSISSTCDSKENIIYLSEGTFNKKSDVNLVYSQASNVTFIGAGLDKTIIDGQKNSTFIKLTNKNTILTFKNITFTNFKTSSNGAVIYSTSAIVNIENCLFKDFNANNAAIYMTGTSNLTVINSNFTGVGGAIWVGSISKLYLENNTFYNITKSTSTGLAVQTGCSNTIIKNNKFINLSALKTSYDASIYATAKSNITNNQFINCTSPSQNYAIAYVSLGIWENNTFINSSNIDGFNIYFKNPIDNLNYTVNDSKLIIGNSKVNNYFNITIFALDNLNNKGLIATSAISAKLTGVYNYTLAVTSKSSSKFSLNFKEIPEDGEYILNITSNNYKTSIFMPTIIQINRNPLDLWVSPEGSNEGNALKENPFKTINYAINYGIEDTINVNIHLMEGNYSGSGNINLDISKKGYISIIGENNNVIINGTSNYPFLINSDVSTFVTLKNLTFVENKGSNGAVLSCNVGNLNISNCIFKNYTSTKYNGAIYLTGASSTLYINNSQFSGLGGAISTTSISAIYLENNTFSNIKKLSGNGLAILSVTNNTIIKANRFINLTSQDFKKADAAIFINRTGMVIVDNIFINCSSLSDKYAIVYVGSCQWMNNTFINSSNTIGESVYFSSKFSDLKAYINVSEFNIGNKEIKNALIIPIKLKDDLNNSVCMDGIYGNVYITINYTSQSFKLQKVNGEFIWAFQELPLIGNYSMNITINNIDDKFILPVNILFVNDPVDVWVSNNGDDSNEGSKENPFKTISYGINHGFENSLTVNVYLFDEIYTGEGNVNLTIQSKGNLNIIGIYNKTIIDGENLNWFSHIGSTTTNFINLTFINGLGSNNVNVISGDNLSIKNSNIINCTGKAIIYSILNMDNMVYINNTGYINVQYNTKSINNSYFLNNHGNVSGYSAFIYGGNIPLDIENSIFINNTCDVGESTLIRSNNNIISRNNYFYNNFAPRGLYYLYMSLNKVFSFENDVYENNKGVNVAILSSSTLYQQIQLNFTNCKFINNSASNGHVISNLTVGNFTNCIFERNNCSNFGLFKISIASYNYEFLTFTNSTFNNTGCDFYLTSNRSSNSLGDYLHYPVFLNITFNNQLVTKIQDTLSVNVLGDGGAKISGNVVNFTLNGENIGSSDIVDGRALINYNDFDLGCYNLSGSIPYISNFTLHEGVINSTLTEILPLIEYWVSNDGSDEIGDGSSESPFKTLEHGIKIASVNCKNIILHLVNGRYDLNLNLSCKNNITIVGSNQDKTVIVGSDYFLKVTQGLYNIVISNLTIQNMLTSNPIIIDSNATLYLEGVVFKNNTNIFNNGILYVNNSLFTNNEGLALGGEIYIDNSKFTDSIGLFKCENIIINNTIIKDIFTDVESYIISSNNSFIENTLIYNSLKEWNVNPAITINSFNTTLNNVSLINNFTTKQFNLFGSDSKNIFANNSKFTNFQYVFAFSGSDVDINMKSCILDNISKIAIISSNSNSSFNITNSIFLNTLPVIDRLNINQAINFSFENNYFENNSKTNISYDDGEIIPYEKWMILISKDSRIILQSTDGENVTDYNGDFPAEIEYCLYDDSVIPLLKIDDLYFKLNVLEDNVMLGQCFAIDDITLKNKTNETVKADNIIVVYGIPCEFIVNYTYWWGDSLNNTNVSITIGNKTYNGTTDGNGTAKFILNLDVALYDVEIINPFTSQSITRTIEIDSNNTIFADDITLPYDNSNKLKVIFTDKLLTPLNNINVTLKVKNITVNATTDDMGNAIFNINLMPGLYNITLVNTYTNQEIIKSVNINKLSTKLISSDVVSVYNNAKTLTVTLINQNNFIVAGVSVNVKLAGKLYNLKTDKNGQIKIAIFSLAVGKYVANINFDETVIYKSSSITSNIIINKASVILTAKKVKFKSKVKTKKYAVSLKNNVAKPLNKAKIILKIKNKTYKATTNSNGKAVFKIKKLTKKGIYKVKLTYAGDNRYNKLVKTVKIIVK